MKAHEYHLEWIDDSIRMKPTVATVRDGKGKTWNSITGFGDREQFMPFHTLDETLEMAWAAVQCTGLAEIGIR